MIRCLAIDDEPLALQQLESYIARVPYLQLVASFSNAVQAKALLQREAVDAVFVDIQMPDLNGLDFVRSLAAPPLVVFTTAYAQYAIEGYKVDAIDYLLKPFGLDEFRRAADKVKARFDLLHRADVSQPDADQALYFKTEYKVVRVAIDEIRYVEAMSEYLRIHLANQRQPLVVLLSMKRMEERLPAQQFLRIHRSYIIRLQNIREVAAARVTLDDGTTLPIGDVYREPFQQYLNSKFLGK